MIIVWMLYSIVVTPGPPARSPAFHGAGQQHRENACLRPPRIEMHIGNNARVEVGPWLDVCLHACVQCIHVPVNVYM